MVLNTYKHKDDDNDDGDNTVNTWKKIPIYCMVKMCGQLTAILAQCAFFCQQEMMAV
jgi:hypothetical protein